MRFVVVALFFFASWGDNFERHLRVRRKQPCPAGKPHARNMKYVAQMLGLFIGKRREGVITSEHVHSTKATGAFTNTRRCDLSVDARPHIKQGLANVCRNGTDMGKLNGWHGVAAYAIAQPHCNGLGAGAR